jgi:hypothetical protein
MSKEKISYLSVMDKMITDDNKGIRMSSTLCSVEKVKQGSVIGFGVENPVGDDANAQLLGLPGENMLMCFAIDRSEFDKIKRNIGIEQSENTVSRMYDRFEQCHCAEIRNLYWLMCQSENDDLKEMLCEMDPKEFEQCFPGVLSNHYSANIQDDKDEIIFTLFNAGYSGLLAEVEYPQMEDFTFGEDGDYKSCSINGCYTRYGYVYAETKEELLQKIELQVEEMVKYWIEEFKSKTK